MAPSTRTALACFVAAALVVAALPLLLPLDDAVYRLIQAARSCDTPWLGKSLGKVVMVLLALAAAVVLCQGKPPPRAMLLAVFAIASGALCGELLKTVCDRLRPDAMPSDVVGNALNLYDTVDRWDDLNHFVNWALHTSAVGLLLRYGPWGWKTRTALAFCWAVTSACLWEFAEFVTFVPNSPEAATAYRDTLGDIALGMTGGLIAAILTARMASRSMRRPTT